MDKMHELEEGEHYYYNEQGYIVLTEKFHLSKGFCCGNGCKHCPYNYENVPASKLLNTRDSITHPKKAH
jgi:hypothetical protein